MPIIFLIMACDNIENIPTHYYFDFDSVDNDTIDNKKDFYEDMCISFVVKSYMVSDFYDIYYADLEEIIDSTKVLTCNRDIYFTDDTIQANTNLLSESYGNMVDSRNAPLESMQNDCYLIRLNPHKSKLSQSNTGYFRFYFNAKTINNRIIRDSTVIKNTSSSNISKIPVTDFAANFAHK